VKINEKKLGIVEKKSYISTVIMIDMRYIVKFVQVYRLYILLGVFIALGLVVLPMIIRGFFYLMLLGLKNPEHMMGYILTALGFYSLGLYLADKKW
tara:strand:+ start:161 stop:448 length:288 start_codon:yes stop_codon:yes gene_type:complete